MDALTSEVKQRKTLDAGRSHETMWQENCQNLMMRLAEKVEKNERDVQQIRNHATSRDQPTNGMKKECMLLVDSNAQHLNPEMLHHEKQVTMEKLFTLEEANKKIPNRQNPDNVSDIVFMMGFNDSKKSDVAVEDVIKRQKEACHKYSHKFKKARFHIAAVPPYTAKQNNLNKQLKDYSISAGISFIDNRSLLDRNTGEVRDGMLNGYHYTKVAAKHVAKELKRSLYGFEPRENTNEAPHRRNQRDRPDDLTLSNQPMDSMLNAFTNFLRTWKSNSPH